MERRAAVPAHLCVCIGVLEVLASGVGVCHFFTYLLLFPNRNRGGWDVAHTRVVERRARVFAYSWEQCYLVFSSLFFHKISNQPYCMQPDCFPL